MPAQQAARAAQSAAHDAWVTLGTQVPGAAAGLEAAGFHGAFLDAICYGLAAAGLAASVVTCAQENKTCHAVMTHVSFGNLDTCRAFLLL